MVLKIWRLSENADFLNFCNLYHSISMPLYLTLWYMYIVPYLFEIATKNLLFNTTAINFVWICQHSSGAIWCKLSDSLYRISSGLRFSKGYHHSCKRGSLMRISWGKLSNRFSLFQFVYWSVGVCTTALHITHNHNHLRKS